MAAIGKSITEAGRRMALADAPDGKSVFGELGGRVVQILPGTQHPNAVTRVRVDDLPETETLLPKILASTEFQAGSLNRRSAAVADGFAVYTQAKPSFRSLKPEAIEAAARAFASSVVAAAGRRPAGCRRCKAEQGAAPMLFGGVVDHLCERCVAKAKTEIEFARQQYESIPMNVPAAVGAGFACALVGAAAWAGSVVLTDRMYWVLGVGVGALVGWGMSRAAGRSGLPIQVLAGLMTVVAMLLGEIAYFAHLQNKAAAAEGATVDWGAFLGHVPSLLGDAIHDTLFTVGAGVVGAIAAVSKSGAKEFRADVHRGTGSPPQP